MYLVGDLELTGEVMELAGDGLVIITYTAEPDSPGRSSSSASSTTGAGDRCTSLWLSESADCRGW